MGNYDRSLQWKMMQQRHTSSLGNPYFSGGYSALSSTGNTNERRSSGRQSLCGTNNDAAPGGANFYMGDERPGPLKRARLTVNTSASGLRPTEYASSKMGRGESPSGGASGSGGMDTPRLAGLVSYLSPSSDSIGPFSYQQPSASSSSSAPSTSESYGGANSTGTTNNEWFAQRGVAPSTSSMTSGSGATGGGNSYATQSNDMASHPALSRQPSLASPTTMFGMENLMADYESGFYSLWNGSNGANVLGYDPETSSPADRQSLSSGAEPGQGFMPEDELKMDYPQLPDLNQGDLDYIYGSMDTPTATTAASRSTGEPHNERPYSVSDLRIKRPLADDNKTNVGGMMSPTTQTSLLSPLAPSGFRNLSRNATMETKRPAPRSHATSAATSTSTSYSDIAAYSNMKAATSSTANTKTAARPSRLSPSMSSSPVAPASSAASAAGSKRPRSRQCDFPGCDNRARSHQKCKKHGGAHQCMFDGCAKNSQSRGLCIAHGGGSRCKVDGCTRAAQSKGLCKSHGGGEFCAVEGCRKKAHLKHLCRTHGGGVRCKDAKCMKWAQRKGWCMAHARMVLDS